MVYWIGAEPATKARCKGRCVMTEHEVLAAVGIGEDSDWEFKLAGGGFPSSVWETYSAMANTDGGTIVLGVEQRGDQFSVVGLPNPNQRLTDFWTQANNRELISVCLLTNGHVKLVTVDSKAVLVIAVPRATRQQRPVYIRGNPLTGTYRRNNEGDFHCTEEEVKRMLGDQSGQSLDAVILEGFALDDLDQPTLQQYRQRWSSRDPDHQWLTYDDRRFLECLGAYRRDRQTGEEGITIAGLLMFGKTLAIVDPHGVPGFHLDYQEWLSENPSDRWTDRVTYDGKWECNLVQFTQRVLPRLTADLKVPFRLAEGGRRVDDTEVHEAIREAFTNALIHADYRGQGGVVIVKRQDRLEFSNPGTLLLSKEQILHGGTSECRNPSLQRMFGFMGYGERAGSGFGTIRRGWESQTWRLPSISETVRPDRVCLLLPMLSVLPEGSVERVRDLYGEAVDALTGAEVQALVTAEVEGCVSNSRMQEMSDQHPANLTKLLQGLVGKGMLRQDGHKRATLYRLAEPPPTPDLPGDVEPPSVTGVDTYHKSEDSYQRLVSTYHWITELPETLSALPADELGALADIADAAHKKGRLAPAETRDLVRRLCEGRYLTSSEIGALLHRDAENLRARVLTPLIKDGVLAYRYPGEVTRPDQAYTTAG